MDLVKIINNDLVKTSGQRVLTDSILVAEKFKKRHDNVIQKIENLIDMDEISFLNFKERDYIDGRGKEYRMYSMDRKSFSMLAMGFTGKKAFQWKVQFISAFEAMEKALLRQQNAQWKEFRLKGKAERLELTEAIQKVVKLAESQGSKNAENYYTSFTRMIYGQVFDVKSVPHNFRDMLDKKALKKLRIVEEQAALWIEEAAKESTDYHQPYQLVKRKIKTLVDVVGRADMVAKPKCKTKGIGHVLTLPPPGRTFKNTPQPHHIPLDEPKPLKKMNVMNTTMCHS